MPLSRDEITSLAETYYPESDYETRDNSLFNLLVAVATAYTHEIREQDRPTLDNPDSFKPSGLGKSHIEITVMGLKENLEMDEELA